MEIGHALVVGGTGMLRGATVYVAERAKTVFVVARRADKISADNLSPISLDYRDEDALSAELRNAVEQHGAFDLAVCWIHGTAPKAHEIIAEVLAESGTAVRYLDVLGSASADPSRENFGHELYFEQFETIVYQSAVLGFVVENGWSRWLSHSEISNGVIEAIKKDGPQHIIGQVRPWSARP